MLPHIFSWKLSSLHQLDVVALRHSHGFIRKSLLVLGNLKKELTRDYNPKKDKWKGFKYSKNGITNYTIECFYALQISETFYKTNL